MKRFPVSLADIADWSNVSNAFYLATRGKGPIAAVKRAQYHAQRNPWFCPLEV